MKKVVAGIVVFSVVIWIAHGYIERLFLVHRIFTIVFALLPGAIILWYSIKLKNKNAELLRIKKENEAMIEELQKKNEELNEFAGHVVHDFRSPLSAVDYLLRSSSDVFSAKKLYGATLKAVDKMNRLLEDLITFIRLGKISMRISEISMYDLAKEVLEIFRPGMSEEIEIKIADDLPMVACDKNMIDQVWQNLIGNAIAYRDKSKSKTTIKVGFSREEGRIVYHVEDNGIGIDPNFQEKVFDPFETMDKNKGTGMGLSVVSRIIEKHGGQVWLESKLGHGTTFYFTLDKYK